MRKEYMKKRKKGSHVGNVFKQIRQPIYGMGQHNSIITCNLTMQLPSLSAYVVKTFQVFSCKAEKEIGTQEKKISK
jgi:hypothetical protein